MNTPSLVLAFLYLWLKKRNIFCGGDYGLVLTGCIFGDHAAGIAMSYFLKVFIVEFFSFLCDFSFNVYIPKIHS